VFVPTAEVVHHEGASTRLDAGESERLFQASRVRYTEKWHGPRVGRALRIYLLLEWLGRGLEETVKLGLGSRRAQRRARLKMIGQALRR
jgi:hypothetical protein